MYFLKIHFMIKSFIFDMDGVIVDNHSYHLHAWKLFCDEINVSFNEAEFRHKYFGKNNFDILSGLFSREVTQHEADELGERKELVYRQVYQNHIKPVEGLVEILSELKKSGKFLAVASSAPVSNLNFVVDNLQIRSYFSCLLDGSSVSKAKPDPEIYIKTAKQLNVLPHECVVFEDSISGINAAQKAGMRVIALLTTHIRSELPEVELYIKDFTDSKLISFLKQEFNYGSMN